MRILTEDSKEKKQSVCKVTHYLFRRTGGGCNDLAYMVKSIPHLLSLSPSPSLSLSLFLALTVAYPVPLV